jgi:hypothetical protein
MTEKNKGGRPPHEPTPQTRTIVEVLAGYGVTQVDIAAAIGVSKPTLQAHYADELSSGSAKVQQRLITNLIRIAGGSDGTALKAIMFSLNTRFGWSQYVPAPEREEVPGKKEQLEQAAKEPPTNWSRLLQ